MREITSNEQHNNSLNKSAKKGFQKQKGSYVSPRRGYDKLSSVGSDKLLTLENILYNIGQMRLQEEDKFTFKGQKDLEGLCITINKLTNLHEQDTLKWVQKLEEGFNINNTEEPKRKIIIHALLSDELKERLPTGKDSRTLLDCIISWSYNKQKFPILQAKLQNNRIRNNERPSEYFTRTLKLIEQADICVPKEDRLLEREKEKYILNGLPKWMQLEQAKQYNLPLNEMMKILDRISDINDQGHPILENRTKRDQLPKGKYCSFHKSTTHNTDECFAQKEKFKETDTSKKTEQTKREDAHTIWERTETLRRPIITVECNNKKLETLLDTGAYSTLIRESTVNLINAKREKLENPKIITVADGREKTLTEKILLKFTIPEIPGAIYKTVATIIPTSNHDIILGTDFLTASNAIFNFKQSYIQLDGYTIMQVGYEEEQLPIPEQLLLTNTNTIYSIKEQNSTTKTFQRLIEHAKTRNPKLGLIKNVEHQIKLKDMRPLLCKPYSIPLTLKNELVAFIQDLIQQNILKTNTSTYLSPAFITRKKNGKLRLLVDYRKLNERTEREEYPFPGIDQLLQGLEGSTIFSTIDLSQGYYQMLMDPQSTQFTAIILPFGCFEFLRMPFGLVNAPKVFQRAVTTALENIPNTKVYIDDILVHSATVEEHLQHLKLVLDRLYDKGFSINFDKAIFAAPEIKFLGRVINKTGIRALIEKELSTKNLKWPETKKQLQKLLGTINWYRQFIPNASIDLARISEKLKQDEKKKLTWSEQEKNIISIIFKKINENITINHAKTNQAFTLTTDASDNGISAILSQEHGIVGIYSSKLNKSEINYTTMEKELLAVIKGLAYYRDLIIGNEITVKTDNKNLTFLNTNINQRTQRWKGVLIEFNIQWEHIKGEHNEAADFLSRFPDTCTNKNHTKENYHSIGEEVDQVKQLHETLGHPGITKLYKTIRAFTNIRVTKDKCRKIVSSCFTCQIWKAHPTQLQSACDLHTTEPGADISLDIIGPINFNHENDVNECTAHILTVVDRHSRFCKLSVLRLIKPSSVIRALKKGWFREIGIPKSILSDQGRQFISQEYKTFLLNNGIKQILTTPYNPQGNGITERLNQEVNKSIRIYQHLPLKQILQKTENNLNHLIHSRTKTTPEIALFGKDTHWNVVYDATQHRDITNEINKRMQEEKNHLIKRMEKISPNDKSWIKNMTRGKLTPRWIGPVKVLTANMANATLTVDLGYKEWMINMRHVRKAEREVDVVSSQTIENF